MSTPIASTLVWHDGTPYDVSTIDRECSAVASYGTVYAETLVFEVKPDRTRGHVLYQSEAAEGSIADHQKIVGNVRDSGSFWDAVETEKPA